MNSEQWLDTIRDEFPSLKKRRLGNPPVYFDNACTTLVPRRVIEAINEYYCDFPACGGNRSRHWFAEEVTSRIEGNAEKGIQGSTRIIQEFIHAGSPKEIIFTSNTSQAINTVALGYDFQPGDIVLLTDREHNSNLIPWLRLQKAGLIKVEYVSLCENESFDFNGFAQKLEGHKVRLVSLAYTSNLTGYSIPAREIIRIAHQYGARVLLDAAQTAPHVTIDVQDLDVDFLAFSIHKMCGSKGVGVLYGKNELLGSELHEEDEAEGVIHPFLLGGGTIGDATYSSYTLLEPPERFEAGTQNYAGQIAAGPAIEYLQRIGLEKIHQYTNHLNQFLTRQLLNQYGDTGWFHILGPQDATQRGTILAFEIKRPNAVGISEELSEKGNVMIRDGAFCAHSYLNKQFGQGWTSPKAPSEHRMTYRISLYFYNTEEECRIFLDILHSIFTDRSYI